MDGWLREDEWLDAERNLPILCVDALPVKMNGKGRNIQVGLILRETPHQGIRWCLLGGRVLRGESLREALYRQWNSALGGSLSLGNLWQEAPKVIEYHPDSLPGRPHDPRKHAVSITYAISTEGVGLTTGPEAIDFRWFDLVDINDQVMGFGQEVVVREILLGLINQDLGQGTF